MFKSSQEKAPSPEKREESASPELNRGKPETEKPKKKPGQLALFMGDLLALLVKIAAIAAFAAVLFTFFFGLYRCSDPYMVPSLRDGDLIAFYRLDKEYYKNDVTVVEYEGRKIALRVAAIAGDTVDITETGLYVNGNPQADPNIYELTERFEEGVEFPLTVGEGEVFLLGDSRENAVDSRVFGPVSVDDTFGQVAGVIRRRNI